ncbi:hypothetical protein [Streptantibioticus cattleyicolor]|uniref:hypothetical protein n=1 Tax=Streptantibioticus cattleyicolor TaxID=29303 RepID=UPI000213EED5|nr:conserved protein of unknown function [Streptantibioticus cattleyicolor NRRL 8057 = DSM 46488]
MPVGAEARRWGTFRGGRTLVVAARTVTSTVRVLETLPELLRGDARVTVLFAYDPTSAFSSGVLDLLRDAGCRVVPWEQLGEVAPDLILSASENIDVPEDRCPVLVLPHGVGFQKRVPDSRAPRTRLSGMVPDALLEAGRAWLAVSHPDQEEQLLATHPKVSGRTLLVGDPCFDQLAAALPDAEAYRRALGVADGLRLVVVSSTWGPTSLLGRLPELPGRLLAALPYDEYRVAAVVHPNVWAWHGGWQVRALQGDALAAGLLLMSPVHAWRAALVAADVVVGDHGSVTLYGAALGKPVLLAAFGEDAVAGTAADALRRTAPALDPGGDLFRQVEEAVADHPPERYAAVAARASAVPGQALVRLRAAVYELLGLDEPAVPPPSPGLPVPESAPAVVTSWITESTARRRDGQWTVTVRRRPAAVRPGGEDRDDAEGPFRHLVCDTAEPDRRLTESASVLFHRRPERTAVAALGRIRETLERFPGCRLAVAAVAGGGCLAGLRDGRVVEAVPTGPAADPGLPAAVVYTALRAGIPLDDALVGLRVGGAREVDVALRTRPAAGQSPG